MEKTDFQLVKITVRQIKELQQLARRAFYETFAWANTAENMQHYLDKFFSEEKLNEEINNPGSEFYFIEWHKKAIGYLKVNFGQAQTDLQDNKSLEIERIYVLNEFQGKNAGKILFEKALQIAKEHKLIYLWLGVWEKNPRAIRFYKKNGFVQFDTHVFKLGKDEQTDVLMKLDLKN